MLSLYAADKTYHKLELTSFSNLEKELTEALGKDYDFRKTAMGVDFDETVAIKKFPIDNDTTAEMLLNGELKTGDNYGYEIAQDAKKYLGVGEDDDLFTEALTEGGHIDLIKRAHPGGVDSRAPFTIAEDLRANAPYVLTEEREIIKKAIKYLQDRGAFVAITSAGAGTTERKRVAGDIRFHKDNWAAGPDKYINLMALAEKNYQIKKPSSVVKGEPVYEQEYDTVILIDNANQGGVDPFIKAARKNPSIKNIIGIVYNNPNHLITKEKIIAEFNKIAGRQETAPPSKRRWVAERYMMGLY